MINKQKTDAYLELAVAGDAIDDPSGMVSPKDFDTHNRHHEDTEQPYLDTYIANGDASTGEIQNVDPSQAQHMQNLQVGF